MKQKPVWQSIKPEETHSGRKIAYRPVRPSFVLALLVITMVACVVHILKMYDLWNPYMVFLMAGSWSSIAASETDVNSPLNQTLMDKIRTNLDYLHGQTGLVLNLSGSSTQTSGAVTYAVHTIDSSMDWRFRNLSIKGVVAWTQSNNVLADIARLLPDGLDRAKVYYQTAGQGAFSAPSFTPQGSASEWALLNAYVYSGAGSAYNAEPALSFSGYRAAAAQHSAYIYVDSSTHALMLRTVYGYTTDDKFAIWNLQITASEQLAAS